MVLADGEDLGLGQRSILPRWPLARAVLEAGSKVGLEEGRVVAVVLLVRLNVCRTLLRWSIRIRSLPNANAKIFLASI